MMHQTQRLAARLKLLVCLFMVPVWTLLDPAHGFGEGVLRRTRAVEIFEKHQAAVVNIHSERTLRPEIDDPFEFGPTPIAGRRVNGMGTGIVLDPRGYILTNHHVVEDVSLLRVRLADDTTHVARVVGSVPAEDLALLKIDTNKPLPTIPIGTSRDLMRGEPVFAIGNSFGYSHTFCDGMISALGRDVALNKQVSYKSLIQINASINPGNSGGPLLNTYGELIGVNVAIRANAQGIAFALPIDNVIKVTTEMLAGVRLGGGIGHGLELVNEVDTTENPVRRWVKVTSCDPSGPAYQAGVRSGDVIVSVNGSEQRCSIDLERALLDQKPGETVPIRVRRSSNQRDEELALTMSLGSTPTQVALVTGPDQSIWKRLGLKLRPGNVEAVLRVNQQLQGGLQVVEVRPDGPAKRGGLIPGDILIGLERWNTSTPESVEFVLSQPDLNVEKMKFYIIRDGRVHWGFFGSLE